MQKKQRQEKAKKDPNAYPSKEELRAEAEEEEPGIVVTIVRDSLLRYHRNGPPHGNAALIFLN